MGTSDSQIGSFGLTDDAVLAQSDFGRNELQQPQAGLSLPQRKLLSLLDGARSLRGIAAGEPTLRGERLTRDAARLLALGLAQLDAELLPPHTRVPRAAPQSVIGRTAAPAAERRPVQRVATPQRSGSMLWIGAGALGSIAVGLGFLFWPAPSPAPRLAATAAVPLPITNRPAAAVAAVAPPAPAVAPLSGREQAVAVNISPAPAAAPPRPIEEARAAVVRTAEEARVAVAAVPSPAAVDATKKPAPTVLPAVAPSITPPRAATAAGVAALEAQGSSLQPAPPPKLTAAQSLATPPAIVPAVPAEIAPASVQTATSQVSAPALAAAPATAPAAATTALAIAPQAREFAPVEVDAARAASAAGGLVPVQRIPPVYPRDAVREGITRGSVRARAILAANGSVERVEFPATDERNRVFERPARSALLLWTFAPGERGRVYEVVLDFVAP